MWLLKKLSDNSSRRFLEPSWTYTKNIHSDKGIRTPVLNAFVRREWSSSSILWFAVSNLYGSRRGYKWLCSTIFIVLCLFHADDLWQKRGGASLQNRTNRSRIGQKYRRTTRPKWRLKSATGVGTEHKYFTWSPTQRERLAQGGQAWSVSDRDEGISLRQKRVNKPLVGIKTNNSKCAKDVTLDW